MLRILRSSRLSHRALPAPRQVSVVSAEAVRAGERGFAGECVSVIWSQPHSSATASLPASNELYMFPKRVPFCDSNCLYKSVQELSLPVSSVCPTAPPQVRESR